MYWKHGAVRANYRRAEEVDLPRNYREAKDKLEAWENNPRRRTDRYEMTHNTFLERRRHGLIHCYVVILYQTEIVTFYRDGRVKLNSGGYQTVTTRDRWNRMGFSVGLDHGVVYYGWVKGEAMGRTVSDAVCYRDGMVLRRTKPREGYPDTDDYEPIKQGRKVASLVDAKRRRASNLRRARKGKVDAWYWEGRQGGYSTYGGNVPESLEDYRPDELQPKDEGASPIVPKRSVYPGSVP